MNTPNRRSFLAMAATAAVAVCGLAAGVLPAARGRSRVRMRVGETADNRNIRVFLNGADVTNRSFEFDAGEGWAGCHVVEPGSTGSKPRFVIDHEAGRTMRRREHGTITTQPPLGEMVELTGGAYPVWVRRDEAASWYFDWTPPAHSVRDGQLGETRGIWRRKHAPGPLASINDTIKELSRKLA